ncbi:MAG TPA: hypothetical protein VFF12_09260 [Myxococcaceae bacterium]|nr:hypothetical protein [Myxococcaceae bacterium]
MVERVFADAAVPRAASVGASDVGWSEVARPRAGVVAFVAPRFPPERGGAFRSVADAPATELAATGVLAAPASSGD